MWTHAGRCRGKAIVNTLVDAQAVVVAEALEVTLDDVEGKALIDMLARFRHLATYWATWRPEKLVDILADNIAEAKAETLGHTLGDAEAVTLVDTLPGTLAEAKARTLFATLRNVEAVHTRRPSKRCATLEPGRRTGSHWSRGADRNFWQYTRQCVGRVNCRCAGCHTNGSSG